MARNIVREPHIRFIMSHRGNKTIEDMAETLSISPASVQRVIASLDGKIGSANPHINKLVYKITGQSHKTRGALLLPPPPGKDTHGLASTVASLSSTISIMEAKLIEMDDLMNVINDKIRAASAAL